MTVGKHRNCGAVALSEDSGEDASLASSADEFIQSQPYVNESIQAVGQRHEIYIRDIRTWGPQQWELLRASTQHYQEVYCFGDCLLHKEELRDKLDMLADYMKGLESARCFLMPVEVARHRSVLLRILPRFVRCLILTCVPGAYPHGALRDLFGEFDNLDDLPPYVLCQDFIRHSVPGLVVPYRGGFHSVQEIFSLFHCPMPSPLMECIAPQYLREAPMLDLGQGVTQLDPFGFLLRFGPQALRPDSIPPQLPNVQMHPLWHKFFNSNLDQCVPWGPIRYLTDTWVWVTQNAPEPEIRYPAFDLLKHDVGDVYRKGRLIARVGCYGIIKTESIHCDHLTKLQSLLDDGGTQVTIKDTHPKWHRHNRCGIPLHYEVIHLSEIQPSIHSILHEDLRGVRLNPLMQDETILFPAAPPFPGLMILGLVRGVLTDSNRIVVTLPSIAGEFEIDVEGCERYVCLARHPGSDHHPPFYLGCPKLSNRERRRGFSLTPRTRATSFDFSWMCSEATRKQDPDVVCLSQYQQLCATLSSNPPPESQRLEHLETPQTVTSVPLRKSSRLSAQRAQANIAMLASQEGVDHTDTTPDRLTSAANHVSLESVVNAKSQIFRAQHIGRPQPPCPEKPQLPTNTSLVTQAPQLKCMSSVGDTSASLRGSKRPALVASPSCPIPLDACPVVPVPCDSSSASDCYPRPLTKRRKRERREDDVASNSHLPPPQSVSTLTTVASQSHPVHEPASSVGGPHTSDEDIVALPSRASASGRGHIMDDEDDSCPSLKHTSASRIIKCSIVDKQQATSIREKLMSALSFLASLGLDVVGSSSSGLYHTFAEPVPLRSAHQYASMPPSGAWTVPNGEVRSAEVERLENGFTGRGLSSAEISGDGMSHICGQHDIPLSESPHMTANSLSASNFNSSPIVGSTREDSTETKYARHYETLYRKYPPQVDLFCKDRQGRRQMTYDHMFGARGSHQASGIRTRRQTRDRSLNGCSSYSPSGDAEKSDSAFGPVGTLESLEALLSETNFSPRCVDAPPTDSVLCLSGSAVNQIVHHYLERGDHPNNGVHAAAPPPFTNSADAASLTQLSQLIKPGEDDLPDETCSVGSQSAKTHSNPHPHLYRPIPAMHGLCPCSHLVPISVTQENTGTNRTLLNFACWRNPGSYRREADFKRCSHDTMSSNADASSTCRMAPSSSAIRRRTPRLSPSHCRANRRDQSATETSSGSAQTEGVGLPSRSLLSNATIGGTVTLDPRTSSATDERQRSEPNQLTKQEVAQLRQRLKILFERLCVTEPKLLEVTHAVASACAHLAVSRRLSTTEFLAIVSVPKLVADRSGEVGSNVCAGGSVPIVQATTHNLGPEQDIHMAGTDNLDDLPPVNWQRSMEQHGSGSMIRYFAHEAGPRILTSSRSMPGPTRSMPNQHNTNGSKVFYSQPSRPLWPEGAGVFDLGHNIDSRRPRLAPAERLHPSLNITSRPQYSSHQREIGNVTHPNGIAPPTNRDLTRDLMLHGSDGVSLDLRQKAFWKYGAKPVAPSQGQNGNTSSTNFQVMRTGLPIAAFAKAPPYPCRPPMQQPLGAFKPPSRQHESQLSTQANVN